MATRIYWFSGSGSCLAIAKGIATVLGDATLLPVTRALEAPWTPAEREGYVFPTYAIGLPLIVERFLRAKPEPGARYVFAVSPCGGVSGAVLQAARDALATRGVALHYGATLTMPDNYPPMGGPSREAIRDRRITDARATTARIANEIAAETQRPPAPAGLFARWVIYPFHRWFMKHTATLDARFAVDESCTHCGTCATVCPMGDIEMVAGRPTWRGRCEQCFACYNWCPAHAIQRGRTQLRSRYHHPDATVAEMAAQSPAGSSSDASP